MEARPRWRLGPWQATPLQLALPLGLYAVALALRWPLLAAPVYGDEGLHFTIAKYWLADPAGMSGVYNDTWWHPRWIFWQRPLYYLAMHLPASLSFDALRITSLLIVAATPAVAYGMLGAFDVGRPARLIAALVLAVDPFLVQWTGIVFMDGPVVLLVLLALWAWKRQRLAASAVLFVAAAWVKETAVFALAALLAYSFVAGVARREIRFWPLALDKTTTALLAALVLAPLPILYGFNQGLAMPGGGTEGAPLRVIDPLFWSIWLVPLLAWGLVAPRTRVLAFLALSQGLFFVLWHVLLDRAVQSWYAVVPMTLAILAATATIDHTLRAPEENRAAAWRTRRIATAGFACLVVLVGILGPAGEARDLLLSPVSHPRMTLPDVYEYETQTRDADLAAAAQELERLDADHVYILDLGYGETLYPFVEDAERAWVGHTGAFETFSLETEPVTDAIETPGVHTLIKTGTYPMNRALHATYDDCAVWSEGQYTLFVAHPGCTGRGADADALWRTLRQPAE